MSETKSEIIKTTGSQQRDLVVAYLSYALDDVQAVSPIGLQLLQLTIAAITEEAAAKEKTMTDAPAVVCH
jgi:hypothetical protein